MRGVRVPEPSSIETPDDLLRLGLGYFALAYDDHLQEVLQLQMVELLQHALLLLGREHRLGLLRMDAVGECAIGHRLQRFARVEDRSGPEFSGKDIAMLRSLAARNGVGILAESDLGRRALILIYCCHYNANQRRV